MSYARTLFQLQIESMKFRPTKFELTDRIFENMAALQKVSLQKVSPQKVSLQKVSIKKGIDYKRYGQQKLSATKGIDHKGYRFKALGTP